jgi:hypothetical protein
MTSSPTHGRQNIRRSKTIGEIVQSLPPLIRLAICVLFGQFFFEFDDVTNKFTTFLPATSRLGSDCLAVALLAYRNDTVLTGDKTMPMVVAFSRAAACIKLPILRSC